MKITPVLSLFLLFPATHLFSQETPIKNPVVTTLVAAHEGWVGGVTTDQVGYVYIADFVNTIWRFNPANGHMERFSDGYYGASGITLDRKGNLYQASYYGHSISRLNRNGISEMFVDEGLNGPVGMVFNQENELLVCNCNDQSIKKVDTEGVVSDFARSEFFNCPNGVTIDPQGNIYVVSFSGSKIVRITAEGETSVFADSEGSGLGHITLVNGIFYATSFADNKIFRITPSGEIRLFAGTGERGQKDGPAAEAMFSNPNGIAADSTGRYLYINDYVGDANASGLATTPFSIRRIELPSLTRILDHALENSSIDDMRQAYQSYRTDPDHAGENTEAAMNSLGWKYLGQDQPGQAVALLELNTESYPDSWRAYSSLGAAYMKNQQDARAIEVLKKSLELNPENQVAKGRLIELGAIKAED